MRGCKKDTVEDDDVLLDGLEVRETCTVAMQISIIDEERSHERVEPGLARKLLVGVMLVGGLDPVNNLLQQQGENEFRRSRAHLHIVHDHISRPGSACSMHVEQMKEHTWLEQLKGCLLQT